MVSTALATTLARRNIHYGWVVVAATFLTMLVTAGAMGAPGVLIKPLQDEFGWETSQISSALAIRLILFGFMGPFAAAFMNYFGVRKVIVFALALIGAGFIGSLFMTTLWQLLVLWGIVVGFGTGLTAMVLAATISTRWFTKHRGLVVGMLSASSATGQLVFLPLMAELTERYGWRSTVFFVCAMIMVAALAVLAFMRDRPADLNLPALGETQVTPPPASTSLGVALMTPITVLKEISRTSTFWILFATFFICGLSTNGLIQTHFVTLCGDFGIVPVAAASVLAVMGIFDFFGTIGSGWLSDRFDNRWLLFWYYGLRGLSLLYLPFSDFSFYGLSIFAVFYGLDWIATVPPTVKIAADRFGREKVGLVFGWVFAGHQLGAATAAYGAGLSRTELSSYLPAFFIAGAFCLLASILAITLKKSGLSNPAPAAAH
ncbi:MULTISPECIES: MFS transporter [unclassified Rhizobium]|uniref:MFS transporter n=1 Tax=unclassified Rhizobium TaxID=2613769 RepID=UPI0007EB12FA|nr:MULTISPECIES: MFS transporter [unclassified Rhizobium]ANM12454.1 major facilitator superfamily protein [Rhizobium sp. N324]ANM18857.1 major facilitator superfamily protein [Rhizobium sp. N541]ANM25242.1 major facilitator superfamily protein [Rhizobium sp. N941]OYD01629.1 major facilitator superfamily protein [Rhizobium sp. N4311]